MNVYDFDNTIYDGDSSVDLYLFCLRRNPAVLRAAPRQLLGTLGYYTKHPNQRTEAGKTAFKEAVYTYFSSVRDMEETVQAFWDSHIRKVKMWYILQRKPDDVVISASPSFLIGPACQRLGIRHQLSSNVGSATGLYIGLNCHGEEKVRRFRAAFGDTVIDDFYSDSRSDEPMARLANRAFLVKGDRREPWPDL